MNHDDERVLVLKNSFVDIRAKLLDYANEAELFDSPESAEEAVRPVVDFFGALKYLQEGDGIIQMVRFADILLACEVIEFKPPVNNIWYDSKTDEELAIELDVLFKGISYGLDDGLTNILRI